MFPEAFVVGLTGFEPATSTPPVFGNQQSIPEKNREVQVPRSLVPPNVPPWESRLDQEAAELLMLWGCIPKQLRTSVLDFMRRALTDSHSFSQEQTDRPTRVDR